MEYMFSVLSLINTASIYVSTLRLVCWKHLLYESLAFSTKINKNNKLCGLAGKNRRVKICLNHILKFYICFSFDKMTSKIRQSCTSIMACIAIILLLSFIIVVWMFYGNGNGRRKTVDDSVNVGENFSSWQHIQGEIN